MQPIRELNEEGAFSPAVPQSPAQEWSFGPSCTHHIGRRMSKSQSEK